MMGMGGFLAGAAGGWLHWRGKLFQVSSLEPLVLLTAAVLLVAVVMLACLAPARRAARIDPMLALRYE
jgi:ABC-type antimicrobial peptide transport system permease subunit